MYSLGQRWPGVDLWTFWLSQVEEEVEDRLGKFMFAKNHQRPFLTNWWALSFESSYPCLDNELVYFPFLGRFMYLIRNAPLSRAS